MKTFKIEMIDYYGNGFPITRIVEAPSEEHIKQNCPYDVIIIDIEELK